MRKHKRLWISIIFVGILVLLFGFILSLIGIAVPTRVQFNTISFSAPRFFPKLPLYKNETHESQSFGREWPSFPIFPLVAFDISSTKVGSSAGSLEDYVKSRFTIDSETDKLENIKLGNEKISAIKLTINVGGEEGVEGVSGLGQSVIFYADGYLYDFEVLWFGGLWNYHEKLLVPLITNQFVQSISFEKIQETAFDPVEIVKNRPEVIKWIDVVKNAHNTPFVQIDSEDDNQWVVHVFEGLSDHLATFNWYYVDKKTGAVSREFDI